MTTQVHRSRVSALANVACRAFVDSELEDVGASVVSGDVEVVLAAHDVVQVAVGGEDSFAREVRFSKDIPQRSNDAAPATHQHRVRIAAERGHKVLGVVASAGELTTRQDEAASFERDVAHGR